MSNTTDFVMGTKGLLKKYTGKDKHVVIPGDVKIIGKEAFYHAECMESVEIPEGVTEIREGAFYWCDKLTSVSIPDRVTKIGPKVFGSCANLTTVHLPAGLTEIEAYTFSSCYNLTTINLPEGVQKIGDRAFSSCKLLSGITIPDGCVVSPNAFEGCASMADENGMLIIDHRLVYCEAGRAFGIHEASVMLPDDLTFIEISALTAFCRMHLQMPISCPGWDTYGAATTYGFAGSIITRNGSTIEFRDKSGRIVAKVILAIEDETEPKANGAILSIRQEGGAFDFAGYDAYWGKLGKTPNKIRVALVRLQYPYALSEEMRQIYEEFLAKQCLNAGKMLIDGDQAEGLAMMAQKQLFSKTCLPKLVDYANQAGKTHLTAQLLATQNDVSANPAPQKTPKTKSKEKPLWKKPKAGTHLVGRYLGTETEITFPTEVDGVSIEGIANTAGVTPENYKALRTVTIPEGYTSIGNRAFAGCENLEKIVFPSSLRSLGSGVFAAGNWEDDGSVQGFTPKCTRLGELYIPKELILGNEVFSNANIRILVMEMGSYDLPAATFRDCNIDDLILIGGDCKSKGFLFDNWYKKENRIFPKRVWVNGTFDCMDIRDYPNLLKQVHPLAELDESIIQDESLRAIVASDKLRSPGSQTAPVLTATAAEVESIDFAASAFVLSGFKVDDEWPIRHSLEDLGAVIRDNVSSKVQYLVIPQSDIVKTGKYKKAVELQEKGNKIAIITLAELKKHIRLHNEHLYGADGADLMEQFRATLKDGEITIVKYIGKNDVVNIPAAIGPYPVTHLAEKCFYILGNITQVLIPDTVQEIPKSTFTYCTKLKTVTLPKHLRVIAEYAFNHCEQLTSIQLPEGLEEIGATAFAVCKRLKKVQIPDSVKKIGEYAFNWCEKITQIRLPEGLETLENGAFYGCSALEEANIPEGIQEIPAKLFEECAIKRILGTEASLAQEIAEQYHAEYIPEK